MKDYFKFNLTGKKLLPIWLLFMVFVVVPYILIIFNLIHSYAHALGERYGLVVFALKLISGLLAIVIIGFGIYFFIAKMTIENIEYKNESSVFNGKLGQFIWLFLKGIVLSIVTFGIYFPWFVEDVYDFFAVKTSYKSDEFQFLGRGIELLKIFLLYYILPLIAVSILIRILGSHNSEHYRPNYIQIEAIKQIITILIAIPFMYLRYKWTVNIKYKNYHIQWDTDFWSSCKMILVQVFLSIITIGIYYPFAILKIYQYFAERTVAVSDERTKKFGYDIEPKKDFLFIWGQILLTIITLGVYYSWAYCKVMNRVLSKTYTEEVAIAE